MDLFNQLVSSEKLHPNFVQTAGPYAAGIRKVLNNWADGFIDRDGKFVKEFQTTYNSSFWELYLFAVLKELSLEVDFSHDTPDFVLKNRNWIIEATIASHAQDDVPGWEKTFAGIKSKTSFEAFELGTIRLANALAGKVQKYRNLYTQLPHVKAKPFIVAISNYSRQDFNLHGDVPLQWLLYDVLEKGSLVKANGSLVDLGLFNSDAFSEVSAVLYSSVATFGKARVLSGDRGDITCHAVRIRNNYEMIQIEKNIADYNESLTDGLRLFLNPYAKYPIDIHDFDHCDARIFLSDRNRNLTVSCHPDGDLCMRFIKSKVRKSTF